MTRCSAWSSPRRSTAPTPTSPRGGWPSCAPRSSTPARSPRSARTIGLGQHIKLGRGEETHRRSQQGLDPLRHRRGGDRRGPPLRRLRGLRGRRAPALRPADRDRVRRWAPGSTGRPPSRSSSAEHGLGVPEYVIEDEGPDHAKTFTAQVRVGDGLYGNGARPLQEGGRAGRRRDGVRRDRRPARSAGRPCRPRPAEPAALTRARAPRGRGRPARPRAARRRRDRSPRSTVLHPRPVRRDPRGPEGFAAALTGRAVTGARRRGKYFWLPLDGGDALLGHLGMSGQMLVQPPDAPAERHLRVRFGLDHGTGVRHGHRAALRRPADVRRPGRLRRGSGAAARDRAHRARPARPGVRRRRVRTPRTPPHGRGQAAAARPGPGLRASATSTPTRRCGRPGSTASVRATG